MQYRYISPKLMRIVLRDGDACNSVVYLQMNWHGDFYRGYSANGDSFTVQPGDEWGNWPSGPLACNAPHAYHWNAQWGALFFNDLGAPNGGNPPLGLYYVHGRWYNPETGLFLSPDEKGDYFYGGAGQDAANYAWIAVSEDRPAPPPRTAPVSVAGIKDLLCKVARALSMDGSCGGGGQPPKPPIGGGPSGVGAGSPPQIPTRVLNTFENGAATGRTTQQPETVFRVEGNLYGKYYGKVKPQSQLEAEELYNVAESGNSMTQVSTYEIPEGTFIWEGPVKGGTGWQIWIDNPTGAGVKLLKTEPLF